jgi:hypothetical protein
MYNVVSPKMFLAMKGDELDATYIHRRTKFS